MLLLCITGMAQTEASRTKKNPDVICGVYLVSSPKNDVDKIKVRITRTSKGLYQGRIVWVYPDKNPDGTERTDQNNPDKSLRNRKATDIVMCWNLKYVDGAWEDGILYDPTSGKRYNIQFSLASNGKDLVARYYKGRPAFGINQQWTRQ